MPSSNRKRTSTRETSAEARHDGGMRDPTGFSEASWQSIVVVLDMQASMQFGAQYTMMDHEKSIHTVRMGVSPGFDDESGSLSPPDFEFPREQLRSQPSSVSSLAAPTPSPENLLDRNPYEQHEASPMDAVEASTGLDGAPRSDVLPPKGDPSIFMSVVKQPYRDRIGVCYFDERTEILFTGQYNDISAVSKVKHKLNPGIILTTAKTEDALFALLAENELDPDEAFNVVTCKKSDFGLEASKNRLRVLKIEDLVSSVEHSTRSEQMLHLMSVLNFDSEEMIQSCGGLLAYLLKNRVVNQLESSDTPLTIKSIQTIPLNEILHCDHQSMKALSIFVDEYLGHRKKEGLSIFALLDRTFSKNASKLLRGWLMYPTQRLDVLAFRHSHVDYLSRAENEDLIRELGGYLRGLHDVPGTLTKFETIRAKLAEWALLYDSLQNLVSIHSLVTKRPGVPLFDQLKPLVTQEIVSLNRIIPSIIDFAESKRLQSGSVSILPGVSAELDQLKRHYQGLEDFLTTIGIKDMKSGMIPAMVTRMNYVYAPQLGYHVQIPLENGATEPADIPGMRLGFKTEEFAFYKNERTDELDAVLGDLKGIIADVESQIVRDLANRVLAVAADLRKVAEKSYELDALIGLAIAAKDGNFCRPRMISEPSLHIEEGRHPLLELCCDRFIPNDTDLNRRDANGGVVHLITGPNSSGKSVYLKLVGLCVYLAHVGSFVPARSATIGVCDSIFTRMRSVDSSNSTLSTFARDASQMSYMLRHCTEKSLLLVDEFGKGTSTLDGISLLASVCNHLTAVGESCPKALVVTHFHEVLDYGLVQESDLLKFRMMSTITQARSAPNGIPLDEIIFLYKLIPGKCVDSFGVHCAELAGMPSEVVQRAIDVCGRLREHQAVEPIDDFTPDHIREKHRQILLQFEALDLDGPDENVERFMQMIRDIEPSSALPTSAVPRPLPPVNKAAASTAPQQSVPRPTVVNRAVPPSPATPRMALQMPTKRTFAQHASMTTPLNNRFGVPPAPSSANSMAVAPAPEPDSDDDCM